MVSGERRWLCLPWGRRLSLNTGDTADQSITCCGTVLHIGAHTLDAHWNPTRASCAHQNRPWTVANVTITLVVRKVLVHNLLSQTLGTQCGLAYRKCRILERLLHNMAEESSREKRPDTAPRPSTALRQPPPSGPLGPSGPPSFLLCLSPCISVFPPIAPQENNQQS